MKASSDIVMGGDGKGPMKKQEIQIKPLPLTLEEVSYKYFKNAEVLPHYMSVDFFATNSEPIVCCDIFKITS